MSESVRCFKYKVKEKTVYKRKKVEMKTHNEWVKTMHKNW